MYAATSREVTRWAESAASHGTGPCHMGGSVRKAFERIALEAVHAPARRGPGAQAQVEADRVGIPVEHRPLQAAAAALPCQPRQVHQERPADARAAVLRAHEQDLQ